MIGDEEEICHEYYSPLSQTSKCLLQTLANEQHLPQEKNKGKSHRSVSFSSSSGNKTLNPLEKKLKYHHLYITGGDAHLDGGKKKESAPSQEREEKHLCIHS